MAASPAGQAASSHAEALRARPTAQDGSAEHGRTLFSLYCYACHISAGVPSAFGTIGPDLSDFPSRQLIAGVVPNTPGNLVRWLSNPQSVKRDTAMPPLGLSAAQANDLVAFLLLSRGPTQDEEPGGPPVADPPSTTD